MGAAKPGHAQLHRGEAPRAVDHFPTVSAMTPVRGVLLAAGAARRFGGGKLLHCLPGTSTPLVLAAWRNLVAVLPHSIAVYRPEDSDLKALFESQGIAHVPCEQAALGMSHSLACGVSAAQPASGWLIALGDMPRIDPRSIGAVARAIEAGAGISIPTYQGQRGHPVGFSARFRDALLALRGDAGARAVVQDNADAVLLVPVEDAGILADVDTPDDLARQH
jgi:molybdenum cofactor cytidylyltransferase